jgi:hypothetical protein
MLKEQPQSSTPHLDRWRAWCGAHGVLAPTSEDFLAHGKLSTLERLARESAAMAAPEGAALRAALRTLRQEKRKRTGPRGGGGRRGPVQTESVDEADLPADWRGVLDRWRAERQRLDAGGILFGARQPPAAELIDDIAYVLRAIARVRVGHGQPIILSAEAVAAWLDAAEARGCKASGLGLQLGLVHTFMDALGADAALRERIAAMRTMMRHRAAHEVKRKEDWLRQNPRNLGGVWEMAEALLADAMTIPAAHYRRAKLVREAAALALGVAAPLRIGDLGRFIIGDHVARTATGWSLTVATKKMRHRVERPELWPELTPFLDAVIRVDAQTDDLWAAYDARIGTPLFARDAATAMTSGWVSDVWEEHVGCGAHIVRTMWHEVAHESDVDLTWMALALCGQKDERTARAYQVEHAAARAMRTGRSLLRGARLNALTSGP